MTALDHLKSKQCVAWSERLNTFLAGEYPQVIAD